MDGFEQMDSTCCPFRPLEVVAKLALKAKFDDFGAGSVFRKSTYPIGHRRFAKNPSPAPKAQIWPQMEFCNYLITSFSSILVH